MAADHDNDYGFTAMEDAKAVRKDAYKPQPDETSSDRQSRRDMAMASWWIAELQRRLRRCINRPDVASYRMDLNAMLDQYASAAASGTVRPPRLSID